MEPTPAINTAGNSPLRLPNSTPEQEKNSPEKPMLELIPLPETNKNTQTPIPTQQPNLPEKPIWELIPLPETTTKTRKLQTQVAIQQTNKLEKPVLELIPLPETTRKPQTHLPIRQPNKLGLLPHPRRTNIFIWVCAFLCFIFSIFIILAGILTLVVFLAIKPRHPSFDTINASLNSIYLDSPELLNGDLTLLANFSNPNRKIDVRFEYLSLELYFGDVLIASQSLEPFTLRRGEARVGAVHMISSEVYLPSELALEIQRQVRGNRVGYNIRGTFRIRESLGIIHFSYWLHGRCQVELTGPPIGVLVGRRCRTKR